MEFLTGWEVFFTIIYCTIKQKKSVNILIMKRRSEAEAFTVFENHVYTQVRKILCLQ